MDYKSLEAELVSNNCKLTPQRKEILKILLRAKTHLTAREIFYRLRRKQPNASFDTVYRNLSILTQIHVIHQLDFRDGRSRFELNRQKDHHHHMVCLRCGETWKIRECPFERVSFVVPDDFKVVNHRFEIFGFCKSCQD